MKTILVNDSFDFEQLKDDTEVEYKIQFNKELEFENVLEITNSILDWEESNKPNINIHLDFKHRSTEQLIDLYKRCLTRESLINSDLIININILVNGYNTLDDSMFENEIIYVDDIEQLLDIKLELSTEIKQFQTTLTKWYLACLKSMSKLEYTYLDNIVDIPDLYKKIISMSNLLTLSLVFAKADQINTNELPLVKDAYPILMPAISSSAIANQLLNTISDLDFSQIQ